MNQREVHVLSEVKLTEIAAMYGVDVADFGPVEGGYRNISHSFTARDGKKYNFILYKSEPDIVNLIRRTNMLGTYLEAAGLSVRAPVDERILRVGRRYGSLYRYLDGVTISWEAYTMKHIKVLGLSLAEFHKTGTSYGGDLPRIEDVCMEIHERMQRYFSQSVVVRALREKLSLSVDKKFTARTVLAVNKGDEVALHMDFVRGNLLFRDLKGSSFQENIVGKLQIGTVELSAILDLEKAARGPVVYDLARTLTFLLVDCPKPAEKVRKYFLDSGYKKRGGGVLPSSAELESLITFFLTYDFYKFLKQNPYESLPKNHHFKRTVDILLERKVLHYSY